MKAQYTFLHTFATPFLFSIGVKHPQSDRLGTLSAQSFLLVGSVSREISSSTTTTNGAELLRSRSTGNSVESAPSLAVRQTNRPTSTPVGSVPQRLPELNQITSLSKQDDSFFTLSPKVEEEAKDDNDKLVPSVPLPDITATPNSELGGPKEKSVIRENEGGAPAVRLRFPPNHENPPSTQNSNNAVTDSSFSIFVDAVRFLHFHPRLIFVSLHCVFAKYSLLLYSPDDLSS